MLKRTDSSVAEKCQNELATATSALTPSPHEGEGWGGVSLVLLLFFLLATAAHAATFVVSPSGHDTNPGTAARPFQTIGKAADTAQAGDTVIVKAGLYREAVHLRHSGTAAAPIKFIAQPMGSVTISGADPVTGWTKVPGDAPIYQVPWGHIFAIDYHNGKPVENHPGDEPLWGRAEQAIADGKQLLPTLGLDGLTKAWQDHVAHGRPATVPSPLPHLGGPFVGCFAVDTAQKALYVWLADGSDPNAHRMEAATRSQTFGVNPWESKEGVQYVQVRGFHFQYGASFPQRAVVWLHGSHNAMDNCLIEDMAGAGVGVGGTLRHSLIRNCGQTGGCAGGAGFVNQDDLWEDNCWKPINRGWDAGGVKIAVVKGGLFQRCVFRHNGGPGLWFDIDVHNVRVTQCVFDENEGSGLFVEISRNNQIDHNLAIGNAIGAVGNKGGWSEGGLVLAESENCRVTNNTCVGNKDGISFREQGPRPLDTDSGNIPFHDTHDVITDNISAFNQGYQLGLWYDNGFFGRHPGEMKKYPTEEAFSEYLKTIPNKVYDPVMQGHTIDHNLYWAGPTAKLTLYGTPWRVRHQEFAQLAAFSAKTNFDTHTRVADPQFVNAAAGDYRLKPNSPARASGVGWQTVPSHIELRPEAYLQWSAKH